MESTATTKVFEDLAAQDYKYGFVTDVEQDIVPGARRGRRPAHLGQEGRAGVAARVAAQGLPRLADDDRADVAERQLRADRLPGHHLLLGAAGEAEAEQPRRGRPRDPARPSRSSASRSTSRSCWPASPSTRCSTGCRWRRPSRDKLGRARHHLLLVLRGGARASRAGEAVPRLGRAAHRQLLRRAQLGGVHRRHLRVHPQGRALPDGAVAPTSASTPRTPASSSAR